MKFEVTLKQLRENKACISGYNKVVSGLKGVEFNSKIKQYIRIKHDAPISLLSILETNGFEDALWCLRCNRNWDRDSRLFAVWCARQVQHLMTDERSIKALDVSENYANGKASQEELVAARSDACAAAWAARSDACAAAWAARSDAAWDAAWAVSDAAWAAWGVSDASDAAGAAWAASDAANDAQKEMFIKMCNGEAPWQVNLFYKECESKRSTTA